MGDGNGGLHFRILTAIVTDDLASLKEIGADILPCEIPNSNVSYNGGAMPLLSVAAAFGSVRVVEYLLEDQRFVRRLNAPWLQMTPLALSCFRGRISVASRLIEAKADVCARTEGQKQFSRVLCALIGGSSERFCSDDVKARGARVETLRLILNEMERRIGAKGLELILLQRCNGATPLHFAAALGNANTIKLINEYLARAASDRERKQEARASFTFHPFLELKDANGETPLTIASRWRNAAAAGAILIECLSERRTGRQQQEWCASGVLDPALIAVCASGGIHAEQVCEVCLWHARQDEFDQQWPQLIDAIRNCAEPRSCHSSECAHNPLKGVRKAVDEMRARASATRFDLHIEQFREKARLLHKGNFQAAILPSMKFVCAERATTEAGDAKSQRSVDSRNSFDDEEEEDEEDSDIEATTEVDYNPESEDALRIVKWLLDAKASAKSKVSFQGKISTTGPREISALLLAVATAKASVCNILVSSKANVGSEELLGLFWQGYLNTARTVLGIGERSDDVKENRVRGHVAVGLKTVGVEKTLDEIGPSLMIAAASRGHADMIQYLMSLGFENVNCQDRLGQTPLMLSVAVSGKQRYRCFRSLLRCNQGYAHPPLLINQQDLRSKTALIHALRAPDIDDRVIHALLAHSADVTVRDHTDRTAADHAKHRYSMLALTLRKRYRSQLRHKVLRIVRRDLERTFMLHSEVFVAMVGRAAARQT